MGDADLNLLMGQLLRAQAYKCACPVNSIRVNTEGKAKDDGCDGWSGRPEVPDDWLGATNTCWQFKAGLSGGPSRLKDEVTKRIPRATLTAGGRFVVVASGSTNGKKGEDDRLATLTKDAANAGIPDKNIEVIGSERLTNWCNQHPAVAGRWAGRPDGLWSLDDWSNAEEHRVPWQALPAVQSELDARRADLDFATGSIHHLHIQGPPGVGKTRFALELCRGAAWRGAVIYIRQASDLRLGELIDGAAADPGVQLAVVADEVQPDHLLPLRDSIGRANGRIRLITVGHSPSPDPSRIPSLQVKPLDRQLMDGVITGWYPAMPREHVDFVVQFAAGYVRLARLAAEAVARGVITDVRGLLGRDEIRGFLDGMLGPGDRRALYVVAVLTSVGWTEEMQGEGEAIAQHLRMDWNTVRGTVEDFHRRLGIAPRGGRLRYISPTPLGIHLAVEAWSTYPDLLKSLPGVLPSDQARDAYYDRLQSMASNPQARDFAREQLAFFFRVDDFFDARAVRRWSALSSADPEAAARNVLRALQGVSVEARREIKDRARRELVWTLVRLAWKSSSFNESVKALALLGEAENETWANNASAEFVARFQVSLGGTSVPYLNRLAVIDELLIEGEGRPSLSSLAVKALARVADLHATRSGGSPLDEGLPEVEWHPSSGREHFDCVREAIIRLNNIARKKLANFQEDLLPTAENLSTLLRQASARNLVVSFFDALREEYHEAREPLRKIIADVIYREKDYWKEMPSEELGELEELHARFEDSSLEARLQQHVGQSPWEQEHQLDLKPLAEELLSSPEVLAQQWPWLTSGDAADAWRLGEALAAVDTNGELAESMPTLVGGGRDLRALCGYASTRRRTLGDDWYNAWVKFQFERTPRPIALLFEVAWRCGATEPLAGMLTEILRSEDVSPQIVGQLSFGRWGESLGAEEFGALLRAMADAGHRETALGLLSHRMEAKREEEARWEALALELVTAPELVRSGHMVGHYRKEVAKALVGKHPGEIAAAIFREQAHRETGTWFAEHSQASQVLLDCVERDAGRVWQAMQPYVFTSTYALMFSIGFPRGIVDRMPSDEVTAWVAEKPEERAPVIARLASKDFSTDETIASQVLGAYADNEEVGSAFLSMYISGSWWGPASDHWDELANSLADVAKRTSLPKLRRWSEDSVRSLRTMAERDRHREAEEDLHGR